MNEVLGHEACWHKITAKARNHWLLHKLEDEQLPTHDVNTIRQSNASEHGPHTGTKLRHSKESSITKNQITFHKPSVCGPNIAVVSLLVNAVSSRCARTDPSRRWPVLPHLSSAERTEMDASGVF